eukprot:scaffold85118_cov33-Phaeocystis_antarctica.AAC.1
MKRTTDEGSRKDDGGKEDAHRLAEHLRELEAAEGLVENTVEKNKVEGKEEEVELEEEEEEEEEEEVVVEEVEAELVEEEVVHHTVRGAYGTPEAGTYSALGPAGASCPEPSVRTARRGLVGVARPQARRRREESKVEEKRVKEKEEEEVWWWRRRWWWWWR